MRLKRLIARYTTPYDGAHNHESSRKGMYLRYTSMNRPTTPAAICEGVVVPECGRKRTQGYQLRWETAPVLLYRFLIIGKKL